MKKIYWIVFALSIFDKTYSQNDKFGFVYIGPTIHQSPKGGNPLYGGSVGFGTSYKGLTSIGIGIEYLKQEYITEIPIYGIFHGNFIKGKTTTAFFTLEPGYIVSKYSPSPSVNRRGGLYTAGGFGIISKTKKWGIIFQVKGTMLSYRITTSPGSILSYDQNFHPGYINLSAGVVL